MARGRACRPDEVRLTGQRVGTRRRIGRWCNALQRSATQRNAPQRSATQTQRSATQRNAAQRSATQSNAAQRSATQLNALWYASATQLNALWYATRLHDRASKIETELSAQAVHVMKALEEETGLSTGFKQSGSLTTAQTKERFEIMQRVR